MIQELTLKMVGGFASQMVEVEQADSNSRFVRIHLNGYEIPEGGSAVIYVKKPDGKVTMNDCIVEDASTIMCPITSQSIACYGKAKAQIYLFGEDWNIKTQGFYINVPKMVYDENAIESSNEYGTLQRLIDSMGDIEIDPAAVENAVKDYMEQNPIITTETDPTVPAWAKAETKPEYTAEEVGAVSTEELPSAINTALAQAKETGLFDGKDGVDGKDGQDGYTPVKNVDYFDGKDGQNGSNGSDGITPHIGANKNWWIGDTDTGVCAEGSSTGGSGGGEGWTLITDATVAEDVNQYFITTDKDGNPFAYDVLMADLYFVGTSQNTAEGAVSFQPMVNGGTISLNLSLKYSARISGKMQHLVTAWVSPNYGQFGSVVVEMVGYTGVNYGYGNRNEQKSNRIDGLKLYTDSGKYIANGSRIALYGKNY